MQIHGEGISAVIDAPSCFDGCSFSSATAFWHDGENFQESNLKVEKEKDGYSSSHFQIHLSAPEKLDRSSLIAIQRLFREDAKVKPFCRIAAPVANQWSDIDWSPIGDALTTFVQSGKPDADTIPAAYTYLGQFIAHELSDLAKTNGYLSLSATTAAFDLRSLFDATEPNSPNHSKWYGGVGVGEVQTNEASTKYGDLPRDKFGKAQIGDIRNDHNLGLAQVHVALSKFYHQVVRRNWQWSGVDPKLETLRRIQEAVLFDYLPRMSDCDIYYDILKNGRRVIQPGPISSKTPFLIPIEFSAACFRMGHSMVRETYQNWNGGTQQATLHDLTVFTELGGSLFNSSPKLAKKWAVDWRFFLGEQGGAHSMHNRASAIDEYINSDMSELDVKWFSKDAIGPSFGEQHNLATVTLNRGIQYHLPSAQGVHKSWHTRTGENPLPILSPDDLVDNAIMNTNGIPLYKLIRDHNLAEVTPLWLYCLLESRATHDGQRLGPFSTRIVFETIHASIEASGSGVIQNGTVKELENGKRCTFHDIIQSASTWKP